MVTTEAPTAQNCLERRPAVFHIWGDDDRCIACGAAYEAPAAQRAPAPTPLSLRDHPGALPLVIDGASAVRKGEGQSSAAQQARAPADLCMVDDLTEDEEAEATEILRDEKGRGVVVPGERLTALTREGRLGWLRKVRVSGTDGARIDCVQGTGRVRRVAPAPAPAAEPLTIDRLLVVTADGALELSDEDLTFREARDLAVKDTLALLTPAARLSLAAELLAPIPKGLTAQLDFGINTAAVDLLLALGGKAKSAPHATGGRSITIEWAELLVGGLLVTAQREQPAAPAVVSPGPALPAGHPIGDGITAAVRP